MDKVKRTVEIAEDLTFQNIKISRVYHDGELHHFEITPENSYVLYDVYAHDMTLDADTMQEIPVTYYHTFVLLPKTETFENFNWKAILKTEVNEKYII